MVLSRQKDESIMIGDDVEITIVDVRGDKVRLGINAPRSIPVHRKEIYEAIQREKAQKAAEEAAAAEKTSAEGEPEAKPEAHTPNEPEAKPEADTPSEPDAKPEAHAPNRTGTDD